MDNQPTQKARKRSSNACQRCRTHKIKCSGTPPCTKCLKRGKECVFDNLEPQVSVSKRYLADLKARVANAGSGPAKGRADDDDDDEDSLSSGDADGERDGSEDLKEIVEPEPVQASRRTSDLPAGQTKSRSKSKVTSQPRSQPWPPEPADHVSMTNPLSAGPINSGFISDVTTSTPVYLGTSSNWAFSRRALDAVSRRLHGTALPREYFALDGDIYDLGWDGSRIQDQGSDHSLPSHSHAIYLVRSVQFHIGEVYHLLDEDTFMAQLNHHYENPTATSVAPHSLWYIHYLLIMAFGKACVSTRKGTTKPSGVEHFAQAMKLLPDVTRLWKDPFTVAEIYCCAALYLLYLDFRYAAYLTIGQALRTALFQGMHTDMPVQVFGAPQVERARHIWWTVYMLDRELSSLMGSPIGIADDNVSASLPAFQISEQATALRLHIKLCRIMARVVSTIYGPDGRLDKRFLTCTKSALTSIAAIAGELSRSFSISLDGSGPGLTRMAAFLHLMYHHCILLSTRPLLFNLFKIRLDADQTSSSTITTMQRLRVLLQMCVDSSQHSIAILVALRDQDLLENLLPFDLEATYCSSTICLMAAFVDPQLIDDLPKTISDANSILDDLVSRGNLIARCRKDELQQLGSILDALKARACGGLALNTTRTASIAIPHDFDEHSEQQIDVPMQTDVPFDVSGEVSADLAGQTMLAYPFDQWTWEDALDSAQLMNVADFLDGSSFDGLSSTFDVGSMPQM